MARPHAAALVEDALHRRTSTLLLARGWRPRTISHTGYGSPDFVRVLGRVVLSRHQDEPAASDARSQPARAARRRGRAARLACVHHRPRHGRAGRRRPRAVARSARAATAAATSTCSCVRPASSRAGTTSRSPPRGPSRCAAACRSSAPTSTFGLVSDIDDTVMITALPRPFIAAWNTFVRHEQARHIVPGMAPLYRTLLRGASRLADLLPVHRGVEHRADADPVPQAARLPGRAAAADRLGADQHGMVPQRPGAQAGGAAPAGAGVPADPLGPGRRRRAARPQDLRRLRPRPPRGGGGDRHPSADPGRAGPLARHPGLQRGVRAPGAPAGPDLPRRRRLRPPAPPARRPHPLTCSLAAALASRPSRLSWAGRAERRRGQCPWLPR